MATELPKSVCKDRKICTQKTDGGSVHICLNRLFFICLAVAAIYKILSGRTTQIHVFFLRFCALIENLPTFCDV